MPDFGEKTDPNPLSGARQNAVYRFVAAMFNSQREAASGTEIVNQDINQIDANPLGPAVQWTMDDRDHPKPMKPKTVRPGITPFRPDVRRPDTLPAYGSPIKRLPRPGPAGGTVPSMYAVGQYPPGFKPIMGGFDPGANPVQDQARIIRWWRKIGDAFQKIKDNTGCVSVDVNVDPNPLSEVQKLRNFRALNNIVTNTTQDCISPPCYELYPPGGGTPICTTTNLITYVGYCIEIAGKCYRVIKSVDAATETCRDCTGTVTVTPGALYPGDSPTCTNCRTDYPGGSLVPCTDCAAATNVPTVAGWTLGCAVGNSAAPGAAYTFSSFANTTRNGANVCAWLFENAQDGSYVLVYHYTSAATAAGCGGHTAVATDWEIDVYAGGGGSERGEFVSGLSCSGGLLSGSHVFGNSSSNGCAVVCGAGGDSSDSDTPSVSF